MKAPAPKPAPKVKETNTAPKVKETNTVTVVAGFKLDTGMNIPAVTRGATTPAYPFTDMPINTSFLLPITIEIEDQKEREAAFKEAAKKLSNRVSGAIRRYKKTNEKPNFAYRTVNDDKLGVGVRVWRVADDT